MDRKELLSLKSELKNIKKEILNWLSPAIVVSSNVEMVRWNESTKELEVTFEDGSEYLYFQVSEEDFYALINGEAKATTDDPNGRWWIGKSSIGAGVHQILDKYRYSKQ